MRRELLKVARDLRARGLNDDQLFVALLKFLSVRLKVNTIVVESRKTKRSK